MGSMRFASTMEGKPTKVFSFDSSPGHAIAVALGGLDEKSYVAELREDYGPDEKLYEVQMRRATDANNPGPHPLVKVGEILWRRPETAPR